LDHTESQVELFVFKAGSFSQMVDGLGYTFMGIAAVLAAPTFRGGGLARAARILSLASGPATLLVLLAYVFYSLPLGVPAALLFPAPWCRSGAVLQKPETGDWGQNAEPGRPSWASTLRGLTRNSERPGPAGGVTQTWGAAGRGQCADRSTAPGGGGGISGNRIALHRYCGIARRSGRRVLIVGFAAEVIKGSLDAFDEYVISAVLMRLARRSALPAA
jgi:hypothetical protein